MELPHAYNALYMRYYYTTCFLVVFSCFLVVFSVFCASTFSCFFGGFAAVACFLVDFAVMAGKGGADT